MLNYKEMPQALKWKQSFKGNSVTAIRNEGNGNYEVYSYDTLIYS